MVFDVSFAHGVTTSIPLMINLSKTVLSGDDNPAFEGVFEFSSISAGGSIGTRRTPLRSLAT